MISVLFTTSDHPLAELIREATGEDCSHCAIRWDNLVVHSNWKGVNIVFYPEFLAEYRIVHEVKLEDNEMNRTKLTNAIVDKGHSMYDVFALAYLAISFFLRTKCGINLPKSNLWNHTGMYLCTEFVTETLDGKADSMITPYKLYLRMQQQKEGA